MKFVQQGGYGIQSPPGSPCELLGPRTITVSATPAVLSWDFCSQIAGAVSVERKVGTRDLTEAELRSIVEALRRVTVSRSATCGADFPVETLDLVTTRGTSLYADDFYAGCPWDVHTGRTFVTGLPNLGNTLSDLCPR